MIPFGKQLHTTRTALGMTQDDLALALDVDKQTVSNWECERTQPWPNKKVEVLTKLIELQRLRPNSIHHTMTEVVRVGQDIAQLHNEPALVRERIIDRI